MSVPSVKRAAEPVSMGSLAWHLTIGLSGTYLGFMSRLLDSEIGVEIKALILNILKYQF